MAKASGMMARAAGRGVVVGSNTGDALMLVAAAVVSPADVYKLACCQFTRIASRKAALNPKP